MSHYARPREPQGFNNPDLAKRRSGQRGARTRLGAFEARGRTFWLFIVHGSEYEDPNCVCHLLAGLFARRLRGTERAVQPRQMRRTNIDRAPASLSAGRRGVKASAAVMSGWNARSWKSWVAWEGSSDPAPGPAPLTRVVVANRYLSLSWKLSTCSRISLRLRLLWKKSVLVRTVDTPCGSLLWTSTVVGGS